MICYYKRCAKLEHSSLTNILFIIYQTFLFPCLPEGCCTTISPWKCSVLLLGHRFGYHFFADNINFCLCWLLASGTPCFPISSFSLAHQKPVAICNRKNYYLLHSSVQNLFPNNFSSWNPGHLSSNTRLLRLGSGSWSHFSHIFSAAGAIPSFFLLIPLCKGEGSQDKDLTQFSLSAIAPSSHGFNLANFLDQSHLLLPPLPPTFVFCSSNDQ